MSLVFAQPPILNFWPVRSKNYHSREHQVKAYETIPPTSDKVLDKNNLRRNFHLHHHQVKSLEVITTVLRRKSWTNGKPLAFIETIRTLRLQGKLPPWSLKRLTSSESHSKDVTVSSRRLWSLKWWEHSSQWSFWQSLMTEWGLSREREALLGLSLSCAPTPQRVLPPKISPSFIIKSQVDTLMLLEEMEEEQPLWNMPRTFSITRVDFPGEKTLPEPSHLREGISPTPTPSSLTDFFFFFTLWILFILCSFSMEQYIVLFSTCQ